MKQRFTKGIIATTLAFCSVFGTFGIVTKPDSKASISASASAKESGSPGTSHFTCRKIIVDGKTFSGKVEVRVYGRRGVPFYNISIGGNFIKEIKDPDYVQIFGYQKV